MQTSGKFLRLGGEKWLLKGVAYGPFDGPDRLPSPDQVGRDLRHMAELGFNTVRLYVPPPRWFCDACSGAGMRILVGWPWPSHTDFLRTRRGAARILRDARNVVRSLREAPAVLGFLVGNEVPALMVRWMGPERVRAFLERLVDAGRRENPHALFAYATFPSTEYLSPRNADFVACNVYLESRAAFERYLARLQNVAGNRPLIISEFGLDTLRHGAGAQTDALIWGWDLSLRAGLAGQVLFAYTDDWFNDGRQMDDWAFGITTRDRREKPVCPALGSRLRRILRPGQGLPRRPLPRFSVIVCTYNGAATLRAALDSLHRLDYPEYEILLIDDGSTDQVPEIAAEYRDVRSFRLTHGGLGAARNFGAQQAGGEILAYLDDDAMADEDWLSFLALAFESERVGCVGGPNLPPPAVGLVEACLAASPGGPGHVLLNDTDAEHVPGCNLAVTRAAWAEIGGFDSRYRTAGDDVDFCWRLMDHGYKIVFQPGAMVWHERRRTLRGYFRQQIGYGLAEAMLIEHHRHRFGKLGGARWRGAIYEPAARALAATAFIYGGRFGSAPYQFLYTARPAAFTDVVTSLPWAGLAAVAGLTALWLPGFSLLAGAMVSAPVVVAARGAWRSPVPEWRHRWPGGASVARVLLFFLALGQPFARSAARWLECVRRGAFPTGPWLAAPLLRWPRRHRRKAVAEVALWSEHGNDRERLIATLADDLASARWPVTTGGDWEDWDFEVTRSRWWTVRGVTATEFHPHHYCLHRLRLHTRATPLTLALAVATAVGVGSLFCVRTPWGLWALAGTFLAWLALESHHGLIASRLMRVVLDTARRLGLHRIDERPRDPEPPPRPGDRPRADG